MMIIIIAASAGGFVLIVIIIAVIISCVMYSRRKVAEKEAEVVKEELNTLRRERNRGRSYRKTISQTISRAFSGIWKRKSVRGSLYQDHNGVKEG